MRRRWLGEYRVDGKLGGGGQGTTFRAHHEGSGDAVVIKVCQYDGKREAQNFADVSQHANLVQMKTSFPDDEGYCIVMQYVEGEPLDQVLDSRGPLKVEEAWRYFKKVVSGVDHLHKHQLIHQDLKPANIVLSREGNPVVVDLGGARNSDGTESVVYTPGYDAPEIHSAATPPSVRSDIFSLGVIFAEMVLGSRVIKQARRNVRSELQVLFGAFGEAIGRSLMEDPALRPPTAFEWLAEAINPVGAEQALDAGGLPDDTNDSKSDTHSDRKSGNMTVRAKKEEIETRFDLPQGSVDIVGFAPQAHVETVLEGQEWSYDLEEERCSDVRHWLSHLYRMHIELIGADGKPANGGLYIRTLRDRWKGE